MGYIRINTFEEAWQGVSILAGVAEDDQIGPDTPSGFRWIQTVITNDVLPGDPKEKVDQKPKAGGWSHPFYNDTPEKTFSDNFEDIPHRFIPSEGTKTVWRATLTLCAVDLSKKWLVLHDIRTYGFDMVRVSDMLAKVTIVQPTTDWAALIKHKALVAAAHPLWKFSPDKFIRKRTLF